MHIHATIKKSKKLNQVTFYQMKARKKLVSYTHLSKNSNKRWDAYYAKKQEVYANEVSKILTRAKIPFHAELPMTIAKGFIKRNK